MKIEGFPTQVTLHDGTQLVVRPLEPQDGPAVHRFFRALPEEDRQYLRDDVTRHDWIERFVRSIDYETVVPFIALQEGEVVGNATLYRSRYGWTKHVAEIRVSVAKAFQRRGLGAALMRLLVRHAISLGLEKMVAHVVDNQVGAKRSLEKAGFRQEAVLKAQVKDIFGIKRDLVVMSNDVSYLWEAMEAMVADYSPSQEG
ncbi:MAG: GNAT family N-acetyltransferase [Acidobacteriota bacterium]